jgi:RND family efflux transporter MFP subunit
MLSDMETLDYTEVETQTAQPKHEPRFKLWIVIALLLVAAGIIAGALPRLHANRQLAGEMRELSIQTVNVISATRQKPISLLTLPAEIKPLIEAPIFPRANGYLKSYKVDIGSKVAAGDLLAEIDMPELDQEIQSSRAELRRAEAALELSKTTAARWVELRKTDSVSEQESAEKTADLALKSAATESARANLGRLEQLKNFSRIVAPFAGIITTRNADIGDLVSAQSARELFHLAALDKLRVFVNVPEKIAPHIAPGLHANLVPTQSSSEKFDAKVVRTAGAISPATRTMLTELEVENPNGKILAGSYAQVVFNDLERDMPLTLPSNTIIYRPEGALVALVNAENKIALRPVETGRDFGRTIEVLNGVTPEDKVIINPADSVANGQSVEIVAAK